MAMKYRLGRKQKRIILSEDGTQEIAFVKGNEALAQKVVDLLNNESEKIEETWMAAHDYYFQFWGRGKVTKLNKEEWFKQNNIQN